MFWQRLLTVVIGIPLGVWVILQGSWPLALGVSAIVVLGLLELRRMLGGVFDGEVPGTLWFALGGLLIIAAAYIGGEARALALTVLTLLALVYFCLQPRGQGVQPVAFLLLAWMYWGVLPSHVILLRNLEQGLGWLLLSVGCTWASDIGAYVVGSLWGRTKLAPKISPNKSIEGAVGGIVFSALLAVLLGSALGLALGHVWWLGIVISVVGQVGDLTESAMKRQAKVKDSGRIFPGHGGVLDRFDSLVFVVPVMFYIVSMMQG